MLFGTWLLRLVVSDWPVMIPPGRWFVRGCGGFVSPWRARVREPRSGCSRPHEPRASARRGREGEWVRFVKSTKGTKGTKGTKRRMEPRIPQINTDERCAHGRDGAQRAQAVVLAGVGEQM